MKRIVPVLIALGILAAFAWTIFFLYRKSQAAPVVFKTEKPEIGDIIKKTVASGAIQPRREIEIKPRVSGVVTELQVEPGQKVKEGDLIAKIQIIPDIASLSRAESALNTARINFDNAKRQMARYEQLFKDAMVSEVEFQKYQLDFQLRKEEFAAAQDNLQVVREGASRKSGASSNLVRSTVAGMVLDVPVKVGASVIESNTFNAGTTIAMVADMGDMIFQGKVDESEVGKIKQGMALEIKIGALDKDTFEGKLEYISPKGVTTDGAIQFEIKAAIVPKEGIFIRAGYSATADVVLDRREKVLTIDEALVQFKDGKPFVEVETTPQKFETRPIELGLSDGIRVEVKSGVDANAAIKRTQGTEGADKKKGPPPGGRRR